MDRPGASVVSVNVGRPRTVQWRGRQVTTAIWKQPVAGAVRLEGVNLDGDDQADRRVHGGADKAVYAYAVEDYRWWQQALGPLDPGTFGENLTTTGVDLTHSHVGDRWRAGSAVLEVSQPRSPCFKLGIRMADDDFPGRFSAARRPGVYLRVVVPGTITAGDPIHVEPASTPAVLVASLLDDVIDEDVLRRLAEDPRVPEGWRRSARRVLGASSARRVNEPR